MSGHGSKMGDKEEAALAALLVSRTHAEAASRAGISPATLTRWLARDDFRSAYRAARRSLVDAAVARLQQDAADAADALKRNLTCGRAGDEIRAACAILELAGRGVESDVLERLEELERLVAEVRNAEGDRRPIDPAPDGGEVAGDDVPADGPPAEPPGGDLA